MLDYTLDCRKPAGSLTLAAEQVVCAVMECCGSEETSVRLSTAPSCNLTFTPATDVSCRPLYTTYNENYNNVSPHC